MLRALTTAASGMVAQETHIDVIAHNMANVGTTGFRRLRSEFQDLLYTTLRAPGGRLGTGAAVPTGLEIGGGTRVAATTLTTMPGTMSTTGNPLDLAIEGAGFFGIRRPDGEVVFTRAGNFSVDADGRLVTSDGLPLDPEMVIPQGATSIGITADGTVSVTMPGAAASQEIGRLNLTTFMNPGGLLPIGRNLYRQTDASGPPLIAMPGEEGLGTIAQGMLEGSNVEVVTEMIDLIASQRAYETNHRVIQAADEMLRVATER
jgi:flagellar basal-body rod protein FlgG